MIKRYSHQDKLGGSSKVVSECRQKQADHSGGAHGEPKRSWRRTYTWSFVTYKTERTPRRRMTPLRGVHVSGRIVPSRGFGVSVRAVS